MNEKKEWYGIVMELAVLDILRKIANESNGKARLTKTQIRQRLIKRFENRFSDAEQAKKFFSPSKIRTAIDHLIAHDDAMDKQVVFFENKGEDKEREYLTNFYVRNDFTDVELKFLIDSVMYSKIVDSKSAEDLTNRIKSLADKRLDKMTPYTSETIFGQRGSMSNIDVLSNMAIILDAIYENRYLTFTMNKYNMAGEQIALLPTRKHRVIPLQVFLNNGQYYMLAEYRLKGDVRTFRLDLMSDLKITKQKVDTHSSEVEAVVRYRSEYIAQHPNVMGGEPQRFTLRVKRDALTILVNTFCSGIQVLPGTVTDDTVDVRVKAAPQGMKQWLLVNYDSVSVVQASAEFVAEMAKAVEMLNENYLK